MAVSVFAVILILVLVVMIVYFVCNRQRSAKTTISGGEGKKKNGVWNAVLSLCLFFSSVAHSSSESSRPTNLEYSRLRVREMFCTSIVTIMNVLYDT